MDIKSFWQQEFIAAFSSLGFGLSRTEREGFHLVLFQNKRLIVNLIPLDFSRDPEALILLQKDYEEQGQYCVQLWEDVWISRRAQVIGRIQSILGLNRRVHARKTKLVNISQDVANEFLNKHHLQGSVKARYKYALELEGTLVAVAIFSKLRVMRAVSDHHRSAELVRFATITGVTVVGGFTKLLQYFIALQQPEDIMSYADRDWSLGHAYENAGFRLVGTTPSLEICLHKEKLERHFPHRLTDGTRLTENYIRIFNTGNLKYILSLVHA